MNRARAFARAEGLENLIKTGTKVYSEQEMVLLRNIDASLDLVEILSTCYGPRGMTKITVNKREKRHVTKNIITILEDLDIAHPIAKFIASAIKMQQEEVGDGTNFVGIFAGELLKRAIPLVDLGYKPFEISLKYEKALLECIEIMKESVCMTVTNVTDHREVKKTLKASISSKMLNCDEFLANLCSEACISAYTPESSFDVEKVRIVKVTGGAVRDSFIFNGCITHTLPLGFVSGHKGTEKDGRVAVYSCGIESQVSESKATVLFEKVDEMMNYTMLEEVHMEEKIKKLSSLGIKLLVGNNNISDVAQQYCVKYGIICLKIPSKFELRRIADLCGAVVLTVFEIPVEGQIGYLNEFSIKNVGETHLSFISNLDSSSGNISTIVVRGGTSNITDNVETALNCGINTYRLLCKDGKLLYGGGAVEAELYYKLIKRSECASGLMQYALKVFAESLETFPKILSKSMGHLPPINLPGIQAKNGYSYGFSLADCSISDVSSFSIFDLYISKFWALSFAVDCVSTILYIDQIVMKKPEVGAKPPKMGGGMDTDLSLM